MTAILDHRLFALLAAPPDLHGASLLLAVALAQWAVFCGPALLVLLWITGDAEDRRAAVGAALTGAIALAAGAALSSVDVTPRPFMDGDYVPCKPGRSGL